MTLRSTYISQVNVLADICVIIIKHKHHESNSKQQHIRIVKKSIMLNF